MDWAGRSRMAGPRGRQSATAGFGLDGEERLVGPAGLSGFRPSLVRGLC